MAYSAICPICRNERHYDNSIHLYLTVKGEKEYVCVFCESKIRTNHHLEDPDNHQIGYKLSDMGGKLFVQKIGWTECETRTE
jgi:hypothetical protein